MGECHQRRCERRARRAAAAHRGEPVQHFAGGAAGASVATVAIFLPAFVFVALSGPLVPWMRRSSTARAVLDGVNVASLALMALVSWQLGRAALVDFPAVVIMAVSLALVVVTRINPAWLILAGGMVGWLTR